MADVTVTPANVAQAATARPSMGTAGEAFAVGKTLYKKTSDGRWYLDDKGNARTDASGFGISLSEAKAAGQPCAVHEDGDINPGGTLVVGELYCVGTTGGLAPNGDLTNPSYRRVLGQATTASNLRYRQPFHNGVQIPA